MVSSTRSSRLKKLGELLQTNSLKLPVLSEKRDVLEQLIFAVCLERSTISRATEAMNRLQRHFIDWNEIRVSTALEIAEVLEPLHEALLAGDRIRRILQWVFESSFIFSLEDLRSKTTDQIIEYLDKFPMMSPFPEQFILHIVRGNHIIPLSEGALRVGRCLGLVKVNEKNQEEISGLERSVPSSEGREFFLRLQLLGEELIENPENKSTLELLKTIEPGVYKRSWIPLIDVISPLDTKKLGRPLPPLKQERNSKMDFLIDEDGEADLDLVSDNIDPLGVEEEPFIENNLFSAPETHESSSLHSLSGNLKSETPEKKFSIDISGIKIQTKSEKNFSFRDSDVDFDVIAPEKKSKGHSVTEYSSNEQNLLSQNTKIQVNDSLENISDTVSVFSDDSALSSDEKKKKSKGKKELASPDNLSEPKNNDPVSSIPVSSVSVASDLCSDSSEKTKDVSAASALLSSPLGKKLKPRKPADVNSSDIKPIDAEDLQNEKKKKAFSPSETKITDKKTAVMSNTSELTAPVSSSEMQNKSQSAKKGIVRDKNFPSKKHSISQENNASMKSEHQKNTSKKSEKKVSSPDRPSDTKSATKKLQQKKPR